MEASIDSHQPTTMIISHCCSPQRYQAQHPHGYLYYHQESIAFYIQDYLNIHNMYLSIGQVPEVTPPPSPFAAAWINLRWPGSTLIN